MEQRDGVCFYGGWCFCCNTRGESEMVLSAIEYKKKQLEHFSFHPLKYFLELHLPLYHMCHYFDALGRDKEIGIVLTVFSLPLFVKHLHMVNRKQTSNFIKPHILPICPSICFPFPCKQKQFWKVLPCPSVWPYFSCYNVQLLLNAWNRYWRNFTQL